ncbi:GATOR complex protein Wdr59 isoform X2 [Frankliniella occidentalis]|uniref:GATOR complex protein Wdr59 isoform X2 n=1 Tax=Frankliniella occidentalis TaxID=133901 RepID=A0A6J1SPP1_FRAOC|nr:GATOR complex protein Wdr59 isoform X2 [Frankliniella occidentalis]
MATRWSSEYIVAEHRDLQANAMAVDYTGNYVLLAGRRYLAIKNLSEQSDRLHKVARQSKYEVGAAEWNPNPSHKELCALSSNQRVEVLCWHNGDLEQRHSLKSHTRVVSDVNWHRFDPNLLASCSIDTFIHVWDMRDTRRPAQSLSAVAGSTQVRWNRLSSFLLATAHDGDIKLWDQRKGTAPVVYISAHLAKIHGLDWSPLHEDQLATSSQDGTVKLFDITNPRKAEGLFTTTLPVWRARYTPFGEGLVTVVVPQLRRGENSLLLWNINNPSAPVHTFVGHTDVVLEFEWRRVNQDSSDFELITWSRDQSLRIWRIEPFLQKLCGHEPDMDHVLDSQDLIDDLPLSNHDASHNDYQRHRYNENSMAHNLQQLTLDNASVLSEMLSASGRNSLSLSLDGASETTDDSQGGSVLGVGGGGGGRGGSSSMSNGSATRGGSGDSGGEERMPSVRSPTQPKTLQQEFAHINLNVTNVDIDTMDPVGRVCTVTVSANGHVAVLQITFPANYPYNNAPSFQFIQGTSLNPASKSKLQKVLKHTAQQRVRKSRVCLEACLRQLVSSLQQLSLSEDNESKTATFLRMQSQPTPYMDASNMYRSFQDTNVPFPRTSGAKFSGAGALVCFGRAPMTKRFPLHTEMWTPRSLSALGPPGTPTQAFTSVSSFYYQERAQASRVRSRALHTSSRGLVGRMTPTRTTRAAVLIYDASPLFLLHRELGEKYIINCHDVVAMCQRNAAVAASVNRRDLVQAWTTAALAASNPEQDPDDGVPWTHHPFGRSLIESMIAHFANQSDIQTAAMLCCAFSPRTDSPDVNRFKSSLCKSVNLSPGGSPYHTIHPQDTSLEGWNYPLLKQNRSNSWSDSLEGLKVNEIKEVGFGDTLDIFSSVNEKGMLDEKKTWLYDEYKRAYADILHRWGLLDARAQVMKYMSTGLEVHHGVEFRSECQKCAVVSSTASCPLCKRISLQCVICHISVRGPSNVCLVCGHGGHLLHMQAWFRKETRCPTGCGCSCLIESSSIIEP